MLIKPDHMFADLVGHSWFQTGTYEKLQEIVAHKWSQIYISDCER